MSGSMRSPTISPPLATANLDETRLSHYWTHAQAREHVIGKGITRFHAVYWPAILLSAGLPFCRPASLSMAI